MCSAHPFGTATGLDCLRTDAHLSGHIYAASWAPDAGTDEVRDD